MLSWPHHHRRRCSHHGVVAFIVVAVITVSSPSSWPLSSSSSTLFFLALGFSVVISTGDACCIREKEGFIGNTLSGVLCSLPLSCVHLFCVLFAVCCGKQNVSYYGVLSTRIQMCYGSTATHSISTRKGIIIDMLLVHSLVAFYGSAMGKIPQA